MRRGKFVLIFLSFYFLSAGQHVVVKPVKKESKTTNLSFCAGLTRSVLFLSRNIKEDNDATGHTAQLLYGGHRLLRVSLEFTNYKSINIEPTWYNIRASTLESNLHIIAKFNDANLYFYPQVGLSFNHFSGFFTGKNDFMGYRMKYPENSVVATNWFGLNVGTGIEYFIKRFSIFGDYKMRMGYYNGFDYQVNIMDVCMSAGIRYTIKVPAGGFKSARYYGLPKKRYKLDVD
jgi:hypothetical protein